MLTESLLLSLVGGASGVALAYWLQNLLPSIVPGEIPRIDEALIDIPVLAFAVALSLATGLLFGTLPAVQSSRVDLVSSLRDTRGHAKAFGLGRRTGPLLAVVEVALAVVLLIGAGLLVKSFARLIDVDPGYDPANVLTMRLNDWPVQPGGPIMNPAQMRGAMEARTPVLDELLDRTGSLPGVEHAGLVSFLPLSEGEGRIVFGIAGRPPASDQQSRPTARPQTVSPGYFQAIGLRLVEGRFLTDDDRATSPPAVVVNEAFARAYFPGERVLGQQLEFGAGARREIVGVVRDVRHQGLTSEPQPELYLSFRQSLEFPFARPYLVVRTAGDPIAILPQLRQTVREVDPAAPLDDVMTMEARLAASVAEPRFYALLLGLFAFGALVLAATGLYGVLSHMVSRRRKEIGVRLALGARRGEVLRMVLWQGFALIAAGVGFGLAAAFGVSRVLSSLLFGVTASDAATYVTIPVLLVLAGLAASCAPALRATRVDPIEALRAE